MSEARGDISGMLRPSAARGGDISQLAQTVTQQPGPAAQIPFGPLQGNPTLLPQFSALGQTRPFGPGESIALANGMTANEMTWTVPMGNRWSVIPGLWMVNGVPTHLNEDQAADMAARSGLQWPFTFDTIEQANQYAQQREAFWQTNQDTTQQPPLWSPAAR